MPRTYHGYFDPAYPALPIPRVSVLVHIPGLVPTWELVPFLLDTGATTTVLHPADALRIGIPLARLTTPQPWPTASAQGVGGTAQNYVLEAGYGFIFADSSTRAIAGQIRIDPYTPASERLPSLLGWDVLRHFHVSLDWTSRLISLEERL